MSELCSPILVFENSCQKKKKKKSVKIFFFYANLDGSPNKIGKILVSGMIFSRKKLALRVGL